MSYDEIYEADKTNKIEKVLSLSDADASFLDITDSNQRTPLTVALDSRFESHLDGVRFNVHLIV